MPDLSPPVYSGVARAEPRNDEAQSSITSEVGWAAELRISRVPVFVYEAKRKIGMFCMSCRSTMNFVRESLFAGPMRNSGSVWRSAFATTNSDGGMSGRMVRSQDPKELQTSLGAAMARYWSNPWATTPAWMKAW